MATSRPACPTPPAANELRTHFRQPKPGCSIASNACCNRSRRSPATSRMICARRSTASSTASTRAFAPSTNNPARSLLEKNIHDMQGWSALPRFQHLRARSWHRYRRARALRFIHLMQSGFLDLYEPVASERHIALVSRFDEGLIIQGEKSSDSGVCQSF